MKTLFALIILCSFAISCQPQEIVEIPCYQTYRPPRMIPATNCANPCTYGYQGQVSFADNLLEVNCTPVTDGLAIYVDSTHLFGPGKTKLIAITIEAPLVMPNNSGYFCSHDFSWRSATGPTPEFRVQYTADPVFGYSRVHLIPEMGWDKALEKGIFDFQLGTKAPLPLKFE